MPSPSVTPKASWNSSRLRAALARKSIGLCGSMTSRRSASSRRDTPRHTWAQPMKKRCSPVSPSMTGAGSPPSEMT